MDTLAIGEEIIQEGTSVFLRRTSEVTWVTEIRDECVHLQTVTDRFKIGKGRFESRIADGDFVVEAQPPDEIRLK